MTQQNLVRIFDQRQVRSVYDTEQEKWFVSVIDVIAVLTGSENPRKYWSVLKTRLKKEGSELATNCSQLKMQSADGKYYNTDVADLDQMFRLIQSIPSPKAEPFKLWLAQLGRERLEEIENPQLTQERMKFYYEQKGYPEEWINARLRGMAIRQNLTDEWKERGITEDRDYAILTAEISRATFGIAPSEHKTVKGLTRKNQNLRDHMTDLELIFTLLGERVTTEISQQEKPNTFHKSKQVAQRGGRVAGNARRDAERELGHSVVSEQNFLDKNPENLLDKKK